MSACAPPVRAARRPRMTACTRGTLLPAFLKTMPVSSCIVAGGAAGTGVTGPERRRRTTVTETRIEFTELLGRRVRMGAWEDQKVSTYRRILEALDEGRWDDAAKLESYFVDEAQVCFAIYR